eukprot:jgi/Ulvmu1/3267/UM151_0015.1
MGLGGIVKGVTKKVKKAAQDVADAVEDVAEDVAGDAVDETKKTAQQLANEAVKAAQELEDAARKAEEALKAAADAALDFVTEDVVDAAKDVVTWTGGAAGDTADWVRKASKTTQRAIYKAGQFVDETAKETSRAMIDAADTLDDVLGDIDEALPDGLVISVGPFDISNEGVSVKPKFEIGLEGGGLNISIGVEDLRDGLDIGFTAEMEVFSFSAEGDDLLELLQSFELQTARDGAIPSDARTVGLAYLSGPALPRMILEATGLNLEGFGYLKLSSKVIQGVGARVQVALGALFPDTNGYRMYGVGGELALKLKLDFELFVGYKDSGDGFKLVLAVPPGVVFEVEWLAADEEGKSALGGLRVTGLENLARNLKKYLQGGAYLPLNSKLLL